MMAVERGAAKMSVASVTALVAILVASGDVMMCSLPRELLLHWLWKKAGTSAALRVTSVGRGTSVTVVKVHHESPEVLSEAPGGMKVVGRLRCQALSQPHRRRNGHVVTAVVTQAETHPKWMMVDAVVGEVAVAAKNYAVQGVMRREGMAVEVRREKRVRLTVGRGDLTMGRLIVVSGGEVGGRKLKYAVRE